MHQRTDYFFLQKANEYMEAINQTITELTPSKLQSMDSIFDEDPETAAEKQRIKDLKFKIKMLFKEFDNGELFYNELVSIDKEIRLLLNDKKQLEAYRHQLEMFIHHLETFRITQTAAEKAK